MQCLFNGSDISNKYKVLCSSAYPNFSFVRFLNKLHTQYTWLKAGSSNHMTDRMVCSLKTSLIEQTGLMPLNSAHSQFRTRTECSPMLCQNVRWMFSSPGLISLFPSLWSLRTTFCPACHPSSNFIFWTPNKLIVELYLQHGDLFKTSPNVSAVFL